MELLQVEQGEQGEQGAEVRAEVRVVRWVLTGIGYTSRPLVLVLLLVYKLHLDAVGDILMEKEVEVSGSWKSRSRRRLWALRFGSASFLP